MKITRPTTLRRSAVFLAIWLAIHASPVQASCLPLSDTEKRDQAVLVVIARVEQAVPGRATLKLEQVLKGEAPGAHVFAINLLDHTSVDMDWLRGQRYLAYLFATDEPRDFTTNECAGTRIFSGDLTDAEQAALGRAAPFFAEVEMPSGLEDEVRLITWAQQGMIGWVPGAMFAISLVGSPPVLIALLGLWVIREFWKGRRHDALILLALTAGSLWAFILKLLLARPRPTPDLVQRFALETDYAFPSGHTLTAVLAAGAIWYALHRRKSRSLLWVTPLLGGVVLLIGFSRIMLGVHWPSDVVGGLAIGLGWIVVVLHLIPQHAQGSGRRARSRK